jgi:hypothetical protein
MRFFFLCVLFLFAFFNLPAKSETSFLFNPDSTKNAKLILLELRAFEDNMIGYTFESDDKSFLDATLSFRTRIFPFDYLVNVLPMSFRPDLSLHFAFTGRFAQYIGTRHSNPIVEKRFNPYMFLEFRPRKKLSNLLFQAGYGHESNGQSIDDSSSFYKIAEFPNNNINETKDKISRGWDYVGTTVKFCLYPQHHKQLIYETEIGLRYFLQKGFMQNGKEEYNPWERDWYGPNYTRNDVAGISAAVTCFVDSSFINKIRISFETGIDRPFTASTVKLLLSVRVANFPISFSYRYGYNSDLAQYGKLTSSIGIESLIPSFQRPVDKRKRRSTEVE